MRLGTCKWSYLTHISWCSGQRNFYSNCHTLGIVTVNIMKWHFCKNSFLIWRSSWILGGHENFPWYIQLDVFIMKKFIDKGYSTSVLEALNDILVYMKVVALSVISKGGVKMAKRAMATEVNVHIQLSWPPRRSPTLQNIKLWQDCLHGTLMKGIDDLLQPVIGVTHNCFGHLAHPAFNYNAMAKQISLMVTIW